MYDASGDKLKKIVTNAAGTTKTTYTYIDGFVYKTQEKDGVVVLQDQLEYFSHAEGRVRVIQPYINSSDPVNINTGGTPLPGGMQGVFDYYLKDNLGSVRAVITEEIKQQGSVCTMEAASEETVFGNEAVSTSVTTPAGWQQNTTSKSSKLQMTGGVPQMGPNVLLKVMAGDKINANVKYYYAADPGSTSGNSSLVNTVLGSLIGLVGHGAAGTASKELYANVNNNLSNLFGGTAGLLGNGSTTTKPRAYLNYLFFDELMNFDAEASGFMQVTQPGDGNYRLTLLNKKALKNGYVYVYLSSESTEPVYFDDFAVTHEQGRLIQEDHYYAYGLRIAGISSRAEASLDNKNRFQGEYAEHEDEWDVHYDDFFLRTYDPQVGRFINIDPYDQFASGYVGMGCDPVNSVDPSGGFVFDAQALDQILLFTGIGMAVGGVVAAMTDPSGDGNDIGRIIKGAAIGAGIGFMGGFGAAGGFRNIFPQLVGTATHLHEVNLDGEGKGKYESQFEEKRIKDGAGDIYKFRSKYFRNSPGPSEKMSSRPPKNSKQEGQYFRVGKTLAYGVTVTKFYTRRNGKQFTVSSIHFAPAAFHSSETLFNVMGHELGHLQLNIDQAEQGQDPATSDQHHNVIYRWQYEVAKAMNWRVLTQHFWREVNNLNLQPDAYADQWMFDSIKFLPRFFKVL